MKLKDIKNGDAFTIANGPTNFDLYCMNIMLNRNKTHAYVLRLDTDGMRKTSMCLKNFENSEFRLVKFYRPLPTDVEFI